MNKRLPLLILVLSFTFCLTSTVTLAAGVEPLVVDIESEPGTVKEFELKLTPSAPRERVILTKYKLVQMKNGTLSYQKPKENKGAVKWVELETAEKEVVRGETNLIKGKVKVPFGASGSHTIVLMVEPKISQEHNGISFMVRYAVRINIRVQKTGLYPQANLTNLALVPDEDKKPQVKAQISNPSQLDYLVSGEATIRDIKRRLIERVTLRSAQGSTANADETRMYPGSTVNYFAKVTKRLPVGTYHLRTFFRFAEHGQIIKNKTIKIEKGDFDIPTIEELGAFSLDPPKLDLKLNPGQRKSHVIKIKNQKDREISCVIDKAGIDKNYKYSLKNWLKLYGKEEISLRKRGVGRTIVTLAVPKDIKAGSYHGHIIFKAKTLDKIDSSTIKKVPLSVIVGQNKDYNLTVRSLKAKKSKDKILLSLDLANQSDFFMSPQAKVIISDEKENYIDEVELVLPEGIDKVLPAKSQRLTGLTKQLQAGNYKAEIILKSNRVKVKEVEKEFKVY